MRSETSAETTPSSVSEDVAKVVGEPSPKALRYRSIGALAKDEQARKRTGRQVRNVPRDCQVHVAICAFGEIKRNGSRPVGMIPPSRQLKPVFPHLVNVYRCWGSVGIQIHLLAKFYRVRRAPHWEDISEVGHPIVEQFTRRPARAPQVEVQRITEPPAQVTLVDLPVNREWTAPSPMALV